MPHPSPAHNVQAPGPDHVAGIDRLIGDRTRVVDVACVSVGAGGAVAAVSLTESADIELVGGERFALYETVPTELAAEHADALLSATFRVLEDAFDPDDTEGPIGLCLLVADRGEMKRRPGAFWSDPPMLYVGYLADGRQVRVGYFRGALLRREA